MKRFLLVFSFAVVTAACAVTPEATPAPATETPAEGTSPKTQREELAEIPGVLEVTASADGEGLHAVICAEAVARLLDTAGSGEPVTYEATVEPLLPACGCTHEGHYYSPGESYGVGCNTCRCLGAGQATCTRRACEMSILSKVLFPLNSETLDPSGRALAVTIVDIMRRYDTMRIRIRGHSAPGEAGAIALSEARAQAVRAFLIGEGIAAGRLETRAVGDSVPLSADARRETKDPAARRVSFDVISL